MTDGAYKEALRLLAKHRAPLDRVAAALLEKETLAREELIDIFRETEREEGASNLVGAVRALPMQATATPIPPRRYTV